MRLKHAVDLTRDLLDANLDNSGTTYEGVLVGKWLRAIETLYEHGKKTIESKDKMKAAK